MDAYRGGAWAGGVARGGELMGTLPAHNWAQVVVLEMLFTKIKR